MSVSRSTSRRRQSGSPARKPRVAGTRNRANTAADGTTTEEGARQGTNTAAGQESGGTTTDTGAVDVIEPAANSAETVTTVDPASEQDATSEVETAEADGAETRSTVPENSGQGSERRDEAGEPRDEAAPGQDSGTTGSTTEQRETAASPPEPPGGRLKRAWRRAAGSESRSGFTSGGTRTVLTAVLLVLALGFGGLAYWFHQTAHALRHEGASANAALVDEATTSEVKGQIGSAVEKLFSYDYSNVGKTDKAAENLLVGEAVGQYDKMFKTVREQAPEQKMKLTSTVARSGVTLLKGDRAEVLVFVNQEATSAKSDDGGMYPSQLTVQAEKRSGEWKISNMSQFAQ